MSWPRRERVDAAVYVTYAWQRRAQERLQIDNRGRIGVATPPEVAAVLAWLNDHEPTLLREALDEAGIRK